MNPRFADAPARYARICGAIYLLIILLGMLGEIAVRAPTIAADNPAATAANLASAEPLWRAGIAGDLLMHLLDIPTIVIFYLLLRVVSQPLALTATVFNIAQSVVLTANKLLLVAPLLLATVTAATLPPEHARSLAYLSIQGHTYGFAIGLAFFGATCLIRGHLIAVSGFLPSALGRLLQLAGVCYLVNTFALLLAPSLWQAISPAILVPCFIGELALALWLTVKGIDREAWRLRAQATR
jgi:hypothetical protein